MSAAGRYSFLWLLLLLLSNHCLLAQQSSTSDLRRQRQQLERDIRRNQQRLNETRREKQAALSQLSLLDRQIGKRRQLIRLLREEVEQIDGYVVAVEDTIRTQQAYIDQLELAQFFIHLQQRQRRHPPLAVLSAVPKTPAQTIPRHRDRPTGGTKTNGRAAAPEGRKGAPPQR